MYGVLCFPLKSRTLWTKEYSFCMYSILSGASWILKQEINSLLHIDLVRLQFKILVRLFPGRNFWKLIMRRLVYRADSDSMDISFYFSL